MPQAKPHVVRSKKAVARKATVRRATLRKHATRSYRRVVQTILPFEVNGKICRAYLGGNVRGTVQDPIFTWKGLRLLIGDGPYTLLDAKNIGHGAMAPGVMNWHFLMAAYGKVMVDGNKVGLARTPNIRRKATPRWVHLTDVLKVVGGTYAYDRKRHQGNVIVKVWP